MILPSRPLAPDAVAEHYDDLDHIYRELWGEHVHHGLWTTGRESVQEAVEALVDLLAERLRLAPEMQVCDIGCGYGATARRLAARHHVRITGLTVSAAQAAYAAGQSTVQGRVGVRLQDWLANTFADCSCDRAYAIESSEHMPDKQRFFDEAFRVLKPGGRLAIYAWLARTGPRAWEVRHLLEPICREGRLPGMGDHGDYVRMAEQAGFAMAGSEDLSDQVRRTWSICIRRVAATLLSDRHARRFLFAGQSTNRVFALTLLRLLVAYRTRSMRYCLLVFAKHAA